MSARSAWIQLGVEEPERKDEPAPYQRLPDVDKLADWRCRTTTVAILSDGSVRRYAVVQRPSRRRAAIAR
jgi:hypothetical protein